MSMEMGARQHEIAIPPSRFTMKCVITEVTDDGDFRQEIEFTDVDVDSRPEDQQVMVDAMRQELTRLRGTRFTSLIIAQGATSEMEFELAEGASPQVRQQIENMQRAMEHMAILPTELVGPGARWRVTMPVHTEQFDMVQSVTYTLQERVGDKVTLAMEMEQSAPQQQMGEAMGQPIELRSYTGRGTGEMEFDLRSPTLRFTMTLDSQFEQAFGQQVYKVDLKIEMRMSPDDGE